MKNQHYTSLLWMLYGFVFIMAITSILEAFLCLYMHYGLVEEFMIRRFSYYIPFFGCTIYGITGLFLLFISNKRLKKNKPLNLPKLMFGICLIIAIGFQFFTEKVSDWHLSQLFDDVSKNEYMGSLPFGKLFDIVEYTAFALRWLSIIVTAFFFFNRLNKTQKTN